MSHEQMGLPWEHNDSPMGALLKHYSTIHYSPITMGASWKHRDSLTDTPVEYQRRVIDTIIESISHGALTEAQ